MSVVFRNVNVIKNRGKAFVNKRLDSFKNGGLESDGYL
jgi:hypothetical protein